MADLESVIREGCLRGTNRRGFVLSNNGQDRPLFSAGRGTSKIEKVSVKHLNFCENVKMQSYQRDGCTIYYLFLIINIKRSAPATAAAKMATTAPAMVALPVKSIYNSLDM